MCCTLFVIVYGKRVLWPKSKATDVVLDLRISVVWVVEADAVHMETAVWVETFCLFAFSATLSARASLPLGKDSRYSLKRCLFTDSGALVTVSLDTLFTNHAEYPKPFSRSHLNVFP